MFKPWQSLLFACAVFLLLGVACFFAPAGGLAIAENWTIRVPDLKNMFSAHAPSEKALEAIKALEEVDTVQQLSPDTTHVVQKVPEQNPNLKVTEPYVEEPAEPVNDSDFVGIETGNAHPLDNFFQSLSELNAGTPSIRVLHYGDSQIEGDRITDYLRLKMQGRFGGRGPGLVTALPVSQSMINRIKSSASWDRYTVFTFKDPRVQHNNFGILGGFCRFSPIRKVADTTAVKTASLEIITTTAGGPSGQGYDKIRVFYGGAQRKTWCEMYDGVTLSGADSLRAGGVFNIRDFEPAPGSSDHVFKFRGLDSPDFYGFSLESNSGIIVDNIGLRGSSGTFFHLINPTQLKSFFQTLNVKLLILQFGGNAMPAIKDSAGAIAYGNYIRYQLNILRKVAPGVSVLFIGPSDMSTKVGTDYVTMPFLQLVRDMIRKAALDNHCAFFDMFACMGGKNSMPVWVEQKLAASDYIHFSPQGARKIAVLLYASLMKQYNQYLHASQKQ